MADLDGDDMCRCGAICTCVTTMTDLAVNPRLAKSRQARSADAGRQLARVPKPRPRPALSPADSARHKRCWLRAARKLVDAHRAEFLTLYRSEREADDD